MAANIADTHTVGLPAFKETAAKYSHLHTATQISISPRIPQVIDIFTIYLSKDGEHQ